ncbi:related to transcription initiation factor TFIID [Ramularia collo-cygni]|uniref:Transcription initiation factor TFIID subunit 10 n=1 Tax=Ramularia collo-cygni TaxID=112498 RepID=A0A2D3VPZ6_9PEZI|nr:related to transcription initiation factor TFIID [Ramularia collo-cygni]CZT24108.1 related to transcription initiation factor TFIID [Ramularia collo-cygni]
MADATDSTAAGSALPPTNNIDSDTSIINTTTETITQPTEPSTEDPALEVDRDLDAEINPTSSTETMVMNMDGANDASGPAAAPETNGLSSIPAVLEPRIPQKKDTSLREFLGKMDDYAPLIPDAVTDYYLTLAGLPPPPETDRRLARLLALATQKFIADIAADAYQYSRIRSTNTTSNNPLTGLGGAAGFGMSVQQGGEGEGAGKGAKKDAGKAQPLGGPRAGFGGGGGAGASQGRTVLTMEDLGMAVGEYGVNVKRGEFYR